MKQKLCSQKSGRVMAVGELESGAQCGGGVTGQAIIKAILAGERDPHELARFRDRRVKAIAEEIARSLEGNWQEDLLFLLQQEQESYEFCQKQMSACDERLQHFLQRREDRSAGASLPEEKRKERLKKKKTTKPRFDLVGVSGETSEQLIRETQKCLKNSDSLQGQGATRLITNA